jgi:hypothetical protein
MNLEKYKWKNIILLVETPNYINIDYKQIKNEYEKKIKIFHKYFVKLLINRSKDFKFKINIINYKGDILKIYNKVQINDILKVIKKIPINNPKITPQNLSLFSDYNKETTLKNLGFKNKEKALYTINIISDKSLKYQVSVISTMIGRAKHHPHQTKEMLEALYIFEKWLENYHKLKKLFYI